MGCSEEVRLGMLLSINYSGSIRILGTCAEGSSIREIDGDGNVVCEMDDNTFPEEILLRLYLLKDWLKVENAHILAVGSL